uniref:THAP4-like heme-binding domain-containing protein n=1 Tax=Spongospora subterranea TaxID=70186 RepID=A0A0H5QLH0_9EUKA|eukprot:CRZ02206.1 hypothetical protein [Spongospora subterranea]
MASTSETAPPTLPIAAYLKTVARRPLHDQIAKLAPLLGTWSGHGRGEYPTIAPFEYHDHIEFLSTGQPFLLMQQRTFKKNPEVKPMHSEMGFWRMTPGSNSVSMSISHAMGLAEISEGSLVVEGGNFVFLLESTHLTRIESASHPYANKIRRKFTVNANLSDMEYTVEMETENSPMTFHLFGRLSKIPASL